VNLFLLSVACEFWCRQVNDFAASWSSSISRKVVDQSQWYWRIAHEYRGRSELSRRDRLKERRAEDSESEFSEQQRFMETTLGLKFSPHSMPSQFRLSIRWRGSCNFFLSGLQSPCRWWPAVQNCDFDWTACTGRQAKFPCPLCVTFLFKQGKWRNAQLGSLKHWFPTGSAKLHFQKSVFIVAPALDARICVSVPWCVTCSSWKMHRSKA
jgi:hypothetical protein